MPENVARSGITGTIRFDNCFRLLKTLRFSTKNSCLRRWVCVEKQKTANPRKDWPYLACLAEKLGKEALGRLCLVALATLGARNIFHNLINVLAAACPGGLSALLTSNCTTHNVASLKWGDCLVDTAPDLKLDGSLQVFRIGS